MSDVKISVIMPVYKVEKYVRKAIESIQNQTLKEFEFLISWYFPNRPKGWIEYDADLERYRNGGYDIIRNYYATLFKDAWDVSKYVVNKKDYLEGSSKECII